MKLKSRCPRLPPLLLLVANDNDTTAELQEMATILFYLRDAQKKYVTQYAGGCTAQPKKDWENLADNFITKHISLDDEK